MVAPHTRVVLEADPRGRFIAANRHTARELQRGQTLHFGVDYAGGLLPHLFPAPTAVTGVVARRRRGAEVRIFPWLLLERQVIITSAVERLSTLEAVKYFVTRLRDSQLSAWASQQSAPLSSRQVLEQQWAALKWKFSAGEVSMPDFWVGSRVVRDSIEFWRGGPDRLRDRILYTRDCDERWKIGRLAP